MRCFLRILAVLTMLAGLSGCASYEARPLPDGPDLKASITELDATIPPLPQGSPAHTIDTVHDLAIDDIGLLAILNDPDLKSEPATVDGARAGVVQAKILPNPSLTYSYGALLGGPGTAASTALSLSQDIVPILTRGARVKAAKASPYQVDADQLWREWQVAQKARQLALDIAFADRSIALTEEERRLLQQTTAQVQQAIAAGDLTLTAVSPLLSATAAADQSLVTLRLERQKNWQQLDGLLGLLPDARFAIKTPDFPPLPPTVERLVADLPERRPDLAALRFGYESSEEDVRAAVLGQFPALSIGGNYGSDTTAVVSAGPSFAFGLPIFDRNQGNIAKTEATREQLRAQYQAQLDTSVATVRALLAQISRLSSDLAQARAAADAARSLFVQAQHAYAQGNLDQRSLTDYETTELERRLQVLSIERQIGEDRILLAVELGLGLPPMRLTTRQVHL